MLHSILLVTTEASSWGFTAVGLLHVALLPSGYGLPQCRVISPVALINHHNDLLDVYYNEKCTAKVALILSLFTFTSFFLSAPPPTSFWMVSSFCCVIPLLIYCSPCYASPLWFWKSNIMLTNLFFDRFAFSFPRTPECTRTHKNVIFFPWLINYSWIGEQEL